MSGRNAARKVAESINDCMRQFNFAKDASGMVSRGLSCCRAAANQALHARANIGVKRKTRGIRACSCMMTLLAAGVSPSGQSIRAVPAGFVA